MSYTIQRQVRLDQSTADALKALADKRGETVSDVIRKAVQTEIMLSQHHYHYGATK
jgi:predicted transcriptional regulator